MGKVAKGDTVAACCSQATIPLQFSQILHLLAGSTEKLNCRIMLKMKEFLEGPLTALWKIIQGICKVSDLT